MSFSDPWLLVLIPLAGFLYFRAVGFAKGRSGLGNPVHLMRLFLLLLTGLALSGPVVRWKEKAEEALLLLDVSASMGSRMEMASSKVRALEQQLGSRLVKTIEFSSGGRGSGVFQVDSIGRAVRLALSQVIQPDGGQVVLVSDGLEREPELIEVAREAAGMGVPIHVVPVRGMEQPDVRLEGLASNLSRPGEGATLELRTLLSASVDGTGQVRLLENGLVVDAVEFSIRAGEEKPVRFRRTPPGRNVYEYRAEISGVASDAIPENNAPQCVVEVEGGPHWLMVSGDPAGDQYLRDAMIPEGLKLDLVAPSGMPDGVTSLSHYDGVIFSNVSAVDLTTRSIEALHQFVDQLGGGFVMIGGRRSFGLGGFYKTPVEDLLPVHLRPPDQEELESTALALVLDRSGSMMGEKIEVCKAASLATAEMLTDKDFLGLYAFDSQVRVVLPMTRMTTMESIYVGCGALF
ncbi:MAG: hypothetical protein AAF514_19275 [Verrucomicrobiota bacterium]